MRLCVECSKRMSAAGQAFTRYICGQCFIEYSHGNTATPKICNGCSEKFNRCQRCLKLIKRDEE